MSAIFLRVKIRSLAEEAKIIRHEEAKCRRPHAEPREPYEQLRLHRTGEVRDEARSALLAYGLLRGRAYAQIERFSLEPPDLNRVLELLRKFGDYTRLNALAGCYQLSWQYSSKPSAEQAALLVAWMRDSQWPYEWSDERNRLWLRDRWERQQAALKRRKRTEA